MEAYSSSYSSSNSSYLTQKREESKDVKQVYPLHQSHNSWLHSVRKSPAKPWKKAPVAPMPPTPVKVYKVDAINFRDVVQQLTGAPHNPVQTNIIARSATALHLPKQSQSSRDTCGKWLQDLQFGINSPRTNDEAITPGFLGMNFLSPTSYSNFCFFPPMSPRSVTTSFESGKVL
ncbi:hypothetical protein VNO78_26530 [Psophocarpus tetragonolobus]|uniref:VQ domain-containing protein n=1 Tax=Psophocarpus tetragonolobus TaxID=3891 RepID=A0AAN9S0E0_PSOTE